MSDQPDNELGRAPELYINGKRVNFEGTPPAKLVHIGPEPLQGTTEPPSHLQIRYVALRPSVNPSKPIRVNLVDPITGFGFTDEIAFGWHPKQDWTATLNIKLGGIAADDKLVFGKGQIDNRHRDFVEKGERPDSAQIEIDLPFRLSGVDGSHRMASGTQFFLCTIIHPLQIAAYNSGFTHVYGEQATMTIEPDNWAAAGYTKAFIELDGFLGDITDDMIPEMLRSACSELNTFIDIYSLCSGAFSLRRLSIEDFTKVSVRQSKSNKLIRLFSFYFPFHVKMIFDEGVSENAELLKNMRSIKNDFAVPYRLYVAARRSFATDDLPSAVIEAVQALEAGLFMYVEAKLRADQTKNCTIIGVKNTTRLINHMTFYKSDPGISLNEALNQLLVQVLPSGVLIPTNILGDCNRLRQVRNDAIHAPHKFSGAEVTQLRLESVKKLIDILADN